MDRLMYLVKPRDRRSSLHDWIAPHGGHRLNGNGMFAPRDTEAWRGTLGRLNIDGLLEAPSLRGWL